MYDGTLNASAVSAANAASSWVLPANAKLDLREFDCTLHLIISKWLKKHGRMVRPKLTNNQKEELMQVFKLMDDDDSGAIDIEELGAAFKLLGFQLSRPEIQQLVEEVDEDGSGELEYPEFLEIMTTTLNRIASEKKSGSQIPFALMATAYRRKKILGDVLENTTESLAGVVKTGEEEVERAKEREAMKEQDRLDAETRLSLGVLANAHRNGALMRTAELSQVNPLLLASTFGARELRAVADLLSNKSAAWKPGAHKAPPRKSSSQHHLPHLPSPDVLGHRRKSSHSGLFPISMHSTFMSLLRSGADLPLLSTRKSGNLLFALDGTAAGGHVEHARKSGGSAVSPASCLSPHRKASLPIQTIPQQCAARTNSNAATVTTTAAVSRAVPSGGGMAESRSMSTDSPGAKPRLVTSFEEVRTGRRHMGPGSDIFMPVKGSRLPTVVRESMPALLPHINKKK